MNGVHDMGGMHGFGRISRDEATYHERWEARVRAMMQALVNLGYFNLDEMRRAVESLPPDRYLSSTYFERWAAALRLLVEEKGLLDAPAIEAMLRRLEDVPQPPVPGPRRDDPALAARVVDHIKHPPTRGGRPAPRHRDPAGRAASAEAGSRFRPGDRVRAKNRHVKGHTRLPRYVRGRQGIVDLVRGVYNFPDTNAHGRGAHPEPVYSVRFEARELWGDAAAEADSLYIDLWESYLEHMPASQVRGRR